ILEPVHRFLPWDGVKIQWVGSSCALVCGQLEPFSLTNLVAEELEPVRDMHDAGLLRMQTDTEPLVQERARRRQRCLGFLTRATNDDECSTTTDWQLRLAERRSWSAPTRRR